MVETPIKFKVIETTSIIMQWGSRMLNSTTIVVSNLDTLKYAKVWRLQTLAGLVFPNECFSDSHHEPSHKIQGINLRQLNRATHSSRNLVRRPKGRYLVFKARAILGAQMAKLPV